MRGAIVGLALVAGSALALAVAFPYGVAFKAESLGGMPFDPVALPTLKVVANGETSGSTGCNRYFGKIAIKGDAVAVGDLAMTRMACFDGAGTNERRFAAALGSAKAWRFDGSRLLLETAQGVLVLVRQ
ncbi:MAG TPA: META domain-containing protein [Beijerinckiaceae bacterium]|nr:META domain-containing protein [Beijerinckiaceae bacterium]